MAVMYRVAEIAVLGSALIALTGCTAAVAADGQAASIKKERLQAEVAKRVTMDPERAADVECAGGLEGQAGATQRCEVATAGQSAPYIVTATVADGSDIRFDVRPAVRH